MMIIISIAIFYRISDDRARPQTIKTGFLVCDRRRDATKLIASRAKSSSSADVIQISKNAMKRLLLLSQ